ncbi:MAG: ATP-binding cassette domain-containing protein, partial [Pseudobutyrivibrio sp.]|nr:ATP-binding cassette domain-containing protein [Pseudobutyrivibrio sp.]
GDYKYQGSITSSTYFDYFPYNISQKDVEKTAGELLDQWKPGIEEWQVLVQMNQIQIDAECLYRPIKTLSHGERTRVMIAVLFSRENEFLLIDEPTNHLDQAARDMVKKYLASKKGFILVSHDRDLLDAVCDHVLVMNRSTIEVQAGNFSTWWENKEKRDAFAKAENEKHLKEIGKLKAAADRTGRWAEKSEGSKIGYDPIKETDRSISSRSYIGAKTKKMQARVKAYEKRVDREIEEKEGLLQDIENVVDLKVMPLEYHKNILVDVQKLSLSYKGSSPLFKELTFQIKQGDRIVISGHNGYGKSSIIKAILRDNNAREFGNQDNLEIVDGNLNVGSGIVISYINQDTSFLKGTIEDFCQYRGLDRSLFLAILRQLDFNREQFGKNMEDFSEGQKKKALIAASLITSAHLYIWDEPLNYIDVFSRMQIEKLILDACPTMLIVEHDARFQEKVATEVIKL